MRRQSLVLAEGFAAHARKWIRMWVVSRRLLISLSSLVDEGFFVGSRGETRDDAAAVSHETSEISGGSASDERADDRPAGRNGRTTRPQAARARVLRH